MKEIGTLIDDIHSLFGDGNISFDPSLFKRFGIDLAELMQRRFTPSEPRTGLSMSNIGRPDRQLWYDVHSSGREREAFNPSTLMKFSYGDIVEQYVLLLARMAGHTVEREQEEVYVDGIVGHIDCVIDGVVVDVKSASTFAFQKFKNGTLFDEGNDPFGYLGQLAGYTEGIDPGANGAFLAFDKQLGHLCLLFVPNDVLRQYRVRERLSHIKKVVTSDDVPERCYKVKPDGKSGNYILSVGCSYCSHKFGCWSDANGGRGLVTGLYSSGPRYFTHIERQPSVDLVKEF